MHRAFLHPDQTSGGATHKKMRGRPWLWGPTSHVCDRGRGEGGGGDGEGGGERGEGEREKEAYKDILITSAAMEGVHPDCVVRSWVIPADGNTEKALFCGETTKMKSPKDAASFSIPLFVSLVAYLSSFFLLPLWYFFYI